MSKIINPNEKPNEGASIHLNPRTLRPVQAPAPLFNYRFNFVNREGGVKGHIDMLLAASETGKISNDLGNFFKKAGINLNVLGAVAPAQPEMAKISNQLNEVIALLKEKKSR